MHKFSTLIRFRAPVIAEIAFYTVGLEPLVVFLPEFNGLFVLKIWGGIKFCSSEKFGTGVGLVSNPYNEGYNSDEKDRRSHYGYFHTSISLLRI